MGTNYKPGPNPTNGPSWLSFLANIKNSLWSVDLFKCESIILNSHWVMVVMDVWNSNIIGFATYQDPIDGPTVCQLFNQIISGKEKPNYLTSDHGPAVQVSSLASQSQNHGNRGNKSYTLLPCIPSII